METETLWYGVVTRKNDFRDSVICSSAYAPIHRAMHGSQTNKPINCRFDTGETFYFQDTFY